MPKQLRILIVAATSEIVEHCARLWLEQKPYEIYLLGRDMEKLQRVANDLKVRSPLTEIHTVCFDFLDTDAIQNNIDAVFQDGCIDIALIAHGYLANQVQCQSNLSQCQYSLDINARSPVLFAEAILKHMFEHNHGKLAIIGSVAGDRGRRSNYLYGASKALLATYAQGVQHRIALTESKVRISLIKPGPTATVMTQGLPDQQRMAQPSLVAQDIVKGIDQERPVIYTPQKWRLIMWIIRIIPFFIFKKMDL